MKKLQKLTKNENALIAFVAQSLLDKLADYDNAQSLFGDIYRHGCQSGMVSELVYYNQTTSFYDEHHDEIWDLLTEQADQLGEPNALAMIGNFNGAKNVGSDDQFKNLLAWYAYEETTRTIADIIGIEL